MKRHFIVFASFFLIWATFSPAQQLDRVVVSDAASPNESRIVSGTIQSVTGATGLTIKPESGTPLVFPMTTVLDMETARVSSHVAGETAFKNGIETGNRDDFLKAALLFREARKDEEKRDWVRRLLTARIVDSLTLAGNDAQAVDEFFLLCRTDPLTPHLASVPLLWRERITSSSILNQSNLVAWLEPEKNPTGKWNPAGRLLAASIFVTGLDRKKGIDTLRELATTRNPFPENPDAAAFCRTVSLLAAAQLWRVELSQNPKKEKIDSWRKALNRFPPSVAAGPTYIVARALEKVGDQSAADALYQKIQIEWPAFWLTVKSNALHEGE